MTDKIQKFIDSLDRKTREYLKQRISSLIEDPFRKHQDIRKLNGWGKDTYRLRVGKIRIIYKITGKKIQIMAVDYRGNVY